MVSYIKGGIRVDKNTNSDVLNWMESCQFGGFFIYVALELV